MRQHIVFIAIAAIGVFAFWGWRAVNPPPPANYEVYYFGARDCGACVAWKARELKAWRADPASETAELTLADLPSVRSAAFPNGYGSHTPVFAEAMGGRRSWAYPTFVLVKDGRVKYSGAGVSAWRLIESRVRDNARRMDRATAS
ncbi:MAG: hypothetical protein AAFX03_13880 [Pseudomonadota bacterium]